MSKNKKFAIRVTEKRAGWTAEITRQVTSRKTVVSKREAGFETEELAQAWAENELLGFVKNQAERNERKGQQRVERQERQELETAKRKAAALRARAEAALEADDEEE
ncbi:DUF3622 domain-containing protein [Vibrio sp. 404]|uniref:DUF3622 domain-containing protein n=1 Tax=Vibrio marinisediminis TaxID=2758441 RepID=A0A7W2FSU7_9VIBR|nr:DUF3622 domain-containing protein [Vibrio marinisediminis]MBA5763620.1 DUF3622 domain-containing protein [Vibrio marinisediminis]